MLLQSTRGDTAVFTFTLTDAAGPIDLGSADVTFTAKRTYRSAAFVTKTLDDDIALDGTSGDSGICSVTIQPEDTDALTHTERFVWDIQVDDGLTITTPLSGRWVVKADVTTPGSSGS